ncbi:MAG TPA: thiamine phosphate synthase [Candidatus Aquilonibacter sp.]|nr:thiamine phosphate synthase [Candidatus Aquilonibacter sp.]
MGESCLLYYITDRSAFPGDEHTRRQHLLHKIAEGAANGVDYIQLREKDLSARELESLACEAITAIRDNCKPAFGMRRATTELLINSRTDVALAVRAAGVHLPANDLFPQDVRAAWRFRLEADRSECRAEPLIAVSCHSPDEATKAAANRASFAVFAPVFEKKDAKNTYEAKPAGLEALRTACSANLPVLALGGITLENASSCLRAGAAGIAAIRLFQENEISKIVRALRG